MIAFFFTFIQRLLQRPRREPGRAKAQAGAGQDQHQVRTPSRMDGKRQKGAEVDVVPKPPR